MQDKKRRQPALLAAALALLLLAGLAFPPGSPALPLADGGTVSLDVRDADLRDVLSALALKLNAVIILATKDDKPVRITFRAEKMSARQALDVIVQSRGLAYVEDGNLLVVGEPETLHKNFFSQMIITRLDTTYVTAQQLRELIDELRIGDVKCLSLDANPNAIWVQGTAQEVAKVWELLVAVDYPENQPKPENQINLDYRSLTPNQVSPARAVELLDSVGVQLKRYVLLPGTVLVFDRQWFSRWPHVEALFKKLDCLEARKEKAFVYQLQNIVARDAAARLAKFDFVKGGAAEASNDTDQDKDQQKDVVKIETFNYEQYSKELLVICPPHLEAQVRNALAILDSPRQKVRVPVTYAVGPYAHEELNAKRSLLSELSGVPVGSMHISRDLSGGIKDNPYYVLWVEETPDKIKLIKDLLGEIEMKKQ